MPQPFILVVDDDPNIATLVSEHLEKLGYKTTFCTDAAQAALQAEGLRVGLIIADIMMPGFGSGVDAYNAIRRNRNLRKDLPVIFLTGLKAESARKVVPLSDPRVRLLHKPTTLETLVATIRELTGDRLKAAPPGRTP